MTKAGNCLSDNTIPYIEPSSRTLRLTRNASALVPKVARTDVTHSQIMPLPVFV